jgi:hypothetical protein
MEPVSATAKAEHQKSLAAAERLSGKSYGGKIVVDNPWVYYDTYVLAAAGGVSTLFNNAAPRARYLSNYPFQFLPKGQAFDIYGFRFHYFSITAASDVNMLAILKWLNQTVVNVAVNNLTPQYEQNLADAFGGALHIVTAPAVTVNSQVQSKWQANGNIVLKKPILVDENVQFLATFTEGAANVAGMTGDYMRVEAVGPRARQSQG